MDSGVLIPLAAMAAVVLIVAITTLTKIRDKEMEVYQRLHFEEMEHARKMQELETRLPRARDASSSVPSSEVGVAGTEELRTD